MSATTTEAAIDPAQHLGLVRFVAHRLKRWAAVYGVELDDLIGEGSIALVRAAQEFNPLHGPFSSFAVACIKRRIVNCVKAIRCKKRLPPGKRTHDLEFDQIGVFDPEPFERHFRLEAAVKRLPPRTRRVISWRYGFDGKGGLTYQQIGDRLGVSHQRARQIEQEAIEALRTALQR